MEQEVVSSLSRSSSLHTKRRSSTKNPPIIENSITNQNVNDQYYIDEKQLVEDVKEDNTIIDAEAEEVRNQILQLNFFQQNPAAKQVMLDLCLDLNNNQDAVISKLDEISFHYNNQSEKENRSLPHLEKQIDLVKEEAERRELEQRETKVLLDSEGGDDSLLVKLYHHWENNASKYLRCLFHVNIRPIIRPIIELMNGLHEEMRIWLFNRSKMYWSFQSLMYLFNDAGENAQISIWKKQLRGRMVQALEMSSNIKEICQIKDNIMSYYSNHIEKIIGIKLADPTKFKAEQSALVEATFNYLYVTNIIHGLPESPPPPPPPQQPDNISVHSLAAEKSRSSNINKSKVTTSASALVQTPTSATVPSPSTTKVFKNFAGSLFSTKPSKKDGKGSSSSSIKDYSSEPLNICEILRGQHILHKPPSKGPCLCLLCDLKKGHKPDNCPACVNMSGHNKCKQSKENKENKEKLCKACGSIYDYYRTMLFLLVDRKELFEPTIKALVKANNIDNGNESQKTVTLSSNTYNSNSTTDVTGKSPMQNQ